MGFFSDILGTNISDQAQQSADVVNEATREAMGISEGGVTAAGETLDPYLTGGQTSYEQLLAQMGMGGNAIDPTSTAMFQNPFNLGQERIKEHLANTGMFMSGDMPRDLQELAMGQYYESYMPMLMGMGQMGQNAAMGFGNMQFGGAQNQAGMLMGGTETAEGLRVQGEAAKTGALGGLFGAVTGLVGQGMGAGMFGGGASAGAGYLPIPSVGLPPLGPTPSLSLG